MIERAYTYKFRLYPNKEQETYLAKVFECCRLVHNHFLFEKQNQCNKHDRDVNAAKSILKYKSARNVDYNRGVVYKPNKKSELVSDCSDNREAIIELKVLQDLKK